MANRSPPTPLPVGSINPIVALAAIAASTAVPPRLRTSSATWLTSGWLVAAMPCVAMTSERVGTSEPLGREPANPPSMVMAKSSAAKQVRRRSGSGGFLGTGDARFEDLTNFAIENTLLKTALGVVSDHAPPERNGDRIAQVFGDFPPARETIEYEFDGETADAAAAESPRHEEFGHAVVDG